MKIPPYGNPLKALLESGQLPDNNVYLYIGELSWQKGKSSTIMRPSKTLVLPPWHSPLAYEWPVNGCDILIIETSPVDTEKIRDLVTVLFGYGAIKATLISHDFYTTTYEKDL